MRRTPADGDVPDHPVVAISIDGAHIEINGAPLGRTGTGDAYREAVRAVARDFAQELDRPVRALVSDEVSARRLVIHPSGRVSDIEPYPLPEAGAAPATPERTADAATSLADSRRRSVLVAALPTLAVAVGGMVAVELSVDAPSESSTSAVSALATPSEGATPPEREVEEPSRSASYDDSPLLGDTRSPQLLVSGASQGGIGALELRMESTANVPVEVLVTLTRADQPAWRRTVSLPPDGRTLAIEDLPAGVYTWLMRASEGSSADAGTVVVRAPEQAPTHAHEPTPTTAEPEPTSSPEPEPDAEPEPKSSPSETADSPSESSSSSASSDPSDSTS